MKKKIGITEVALRDAHQSLFATRMLTSDMLPICEKLDKVGYFSLEVWGGATFDSCIRFLNEDPWERLRKLRKALPNSKLQMLLRGQNLLGYRHYADDVVDKFVEVAAKNGIDIFRIFDALNDIRNMERSIYAVKKAGKHAQVALSYTVTPVHTLDLFVKLAVEIEKLGADSITIKDMSGLLKPYDAYNLVSELKRKIKIPISIHSHSTTGMSTTSLIKAIEAGADIVDTAISPLSLGSSHSPTETIVEILKKTDYDTDLDLKLLNEIASYFREIRKKYSDYESSFTSVDTRILLSQIPGGMLSNLENQLKEQNALDKLDNVIEEIQIVQRDFGYPPLVTPTSQIIGTQAVLNVIFGRYEKLTNESKNLLVGRYGKTPAKPDSKLLLRALTTLNLESPIEVRPADLIPYELEKLKEELKDKGYTNFSDEDLLTYAMFPQIALNFFEKRKDGPVKIEQLKKVEKEKVEDKNKKIKSYLVNVNGKDFNVAIVDETEIYIEDLQKFKKLDLNNVSDEKINSEKDKNSQTDDNKKKKSEIVSPVAGILLKNIFKNGDTVKEGETISIIESMKMELEIKSHLSGKIEYIKNPQEKLEGNSIIAYIYQ
jgi:oxaloacetate decarboxylase alpha subunit